MEILASRSYNHLRAVFFEYPKVAKHDIETAIKKELSGDLEKAMLTIGRCSAIHVPNRPYFFFFLRVLILMDFAVSGAMRKN